MLPECIPQTGQVLPNYPDRRLRRIRIIRETILHPENSSMQDIRVRECMIQGVAVHVIKSL